MADENGGIFMPKKYNTIIIGGGTAGLTAAIYTARQNKSVAVFESGIFGGQIVDSPRIENYPGFCEISGDEFSDRLLKQALKLGAELIKKEQPQLSLRVRTNMLFLLTAKKLNAIKL
jgi:thioredoxin reductase